MLLSRRITGAAAVALLAATAVSAAPVVVCGVASGLSWDRFVDLFVVSNTAIGLSLAVAGAPIAWHRRDNPIGWLLLAGGLAWITTAAGVAVLAWADRMGWHSAPWRILATVTNGSWEWALCLCLPLALMLIPDGHLPSRRWIWLAGIAAVDAAMFSFIGVAGQDSLTSQVGVPGYLTLQHGHRLDWLVAVVGIGVVVTYVAAVAALMARYRTGTEVARRQLLWPLMALLVVVVSFSLDPLLPDSIFTVLPIMLIPASIAVAVLRYGLLDIQFVFSRSLLYVLLSAGVIATYATVVVGSDRLWRHSGATAPTVVAALVIAAAFNPARVWLQRRVNRAIYGARQDPVRAVAEVSARLDQIGDATGSELTAVLEALCEVLRLPAATITVDNHVIASHGHAPPARHAMPLRSGGAGLGELVVGLRPGESRLSASDERVLALLTAPIAVAVHAGALAEELRRSREQVVTAREEERRRMRRDLHDGLGPILTGVVLNADAARRLVAVDPVRSESLMVELGNQTRSALAEIRRLVYDLRPSALDSLGLVGALTEHATSITSRADGAPLRLTVQSAGTAVDLPAAVEVAAYRIVTEALTNVTRHSSASAAVITIAFDADGLQLHVHDDGVNIGRGWQPGVGLTSIRERVAELGGRCVIQHDRTGGRVDVTLPLARARVPTAGRPI